jgi:hypothetical protein
VPSTLVRSVGRRVQAAQLLDELGGGVVANSKEDMAGTALPQRGRTRPAMSLLIPRYP